MIIPEQRLHVGATVVLIISDRRGRNKEINETNKHDRDLK